ncbi:hypothetical protein ATK74_2952 [Propionicimonas paludicola]|uniref:Uncharacterized protein n=1 Tax=Propionicimonas paludicola TaxID=185243 RepID=A0A2A9CVA9_9ACTN|nr:hypothetical protein [Propionicimonas paludicola]PFG18367.1 hypothetical protein ATK74_2952 [Propionicimonas paludicola]
MTNAIIVASGGQLAVAVAALTGGALDPESTTVVVVSPGEAAEVQTELIEAARIVARRHRLRLVHLNEVLTPFHPLGWRAADLEATQFADAWAAAGGLAATTVLHCFGSGDPAQRGLARVLGAQRRRIADTAREAGVALRRAREPRLLAGGGAGLAVLIRLRAAQVGQITGRRIAQAAAELAELGVAQPVPSGAIALWRGPLWHGLLRGRQDVRPVDATAGVEQTPDSGESALDFVRRCIEDLDAQRGAGSDRLS